MKAKPFQMLQTIRFGFLAVFLVSCGSSTSFPVDPPNPTNTITPTETFEPFATSTIEPTLTNAPTSQKTSLSGIVFLTDPAQQGGWPLLPSYIELVREGIINIAEYPDENRPQIFTFANIEPGTYQLWVLIPPDTLSLKNCYDVGLPDKTWKLGKIIVMIDYFCLQIEATEKYFYKLWMTIRTTQRPMNFMQL